MAKLAKGLLLGWVLFSGCFYAASAYSYTKDATSNNLVVPFAVNSQLNANYMSPVVIQCTANQACKYYIKSNDIKCAFSVSSCTGNLATLPVVTVSN